MLIESLFVKRKPKVGVTYVSLTRPCHQLHTYYKYTWFFNSFSKFLYILKGKCYIYFNNVVYRLEQKADFTDVKYNFSISACFVSSTYSRNRFLIKLYITSLRINITQNLSQFDTWRFVIKAGESSASRLKRG